MKKREEMVKTRKEYTKLEITENELKIPKELLESKFNTIVIKNNPRMNGLYLY
jgi:hypothetical protein